MLGGDQKAVLRVTLYTETCTIAFLGYFKDENIIFGIQVSIKSNINVIKIM